MNSSYIKYCESLWQKWNNDSTLFNLEIKNAVSDSFYDILELDHCPEPYLVFNQNNDIKESLVFLTTNPGGGMQEQTKQCIESSVGVSLEEDYLTVSSKLSTYYKNNLPSNALNRIKKMNQLANLLGYKGFIQVELFPFHSKNLGFKYKNEIIKLYREENNLVFNYIQCLIEFLKNKDVIAIAASNSHGNINEMNNWLRWIFQDILNVKYPNSYILGYSDNGKPSKSFTIDGHNEFIKGMSLISGINNLPNLETLNDISKIVFELKGLVSQ